MEQLARLYCTTCGLCSHIGALLMYVHIYVCMYVCMMYVCIYVCMYNFMISQ